MSAEINMVNEIDPLPSHSNVRDEHVLKGQGTKDTGMVMTLATSDASHVLSCKTRLFPDVSYGYHGHVLNKKLHQI